MTSRTTRVSLESSVQQLVSVTAPAYQFYEAHFLERPPSVQLLERLECFATLDFLTPDFVLEAVIKEVAHALFPASDFARTATRHTRERLLRHTIPTPDHLPDAHADAAPGLVRLWYLDGGRVWTATIQLQQARAAGSFRDEHEYNAEEGKITLGVP